MLDEKDRIKEVAKLMSGENITEVKLKRGKRIDGDKELVLFL